MDNVKKIDGHLIEVEVFPVENEETVPEVPVQEQCTININQLRIKNGLKPSYGGDIEIVILVKFDKEYLINQIINGINDLQRKQAKEMIIL
ncbi:hypothetical protein [Clostridium tunisiense]|uniref:hypothetical protein n=1 Tax=Clostridium tunisiense TaxID=219748 RepID=UPI0003015983|nr:hypothetical protein [Clostridium tunisiense]